MASHTCTMCGFEVSCSHGRWLDRHPAAAALFALLAGFTLVSVTLAYPWFVVPLLVLLAAWWVDRRNRQRAAIAARADREHRDLMARPNVSPQLAPVKPPSRRPRPRGADHWADTEPIRKL
jgi:hypothetical protein